MRNLKCYRVHLGGLGWITGFVPNFSMTPSTFKKAKAFRKSDLRAVKRLAKKHYPLCKLTVWKLVEV